MKTKSFVLALCLSLLFYMASAPVVRADGPGDLDPTFGSQGKVTTDFGFGNSEAKAVVMQTDGKIVVAGYGYNGSGYDFALARYQNNGHLDLTFGSDGIITTPLSNDDELGEAAIALQANGNIVLVGSSNGNFAVARYQSNGQLDPTFSEDGIVVTDLGDEGDAARAVALQADGKIVVAGYSSGNFALLRFKGNGILDPTFNDDGIVITRVGIFGGAKAVAIQSDGKILAAGTSHTTQSGDNFSLVRYKSDGSLDPSFGNGGISITDFGGIDELNAMTLQPDGKIVVAGRNWGSDGNNFALARYLSNGSPDPGFDTDGKVITPSFGEANALVLQPDGRIVAAGSSGNFALARYNQNGTLDSTFDSDGRVTTDFANHFDTANAVALQTDGKIVAVGTNSITFALARYTNSGSLDSTFDSDGAQVLSTNGDGKITTIIGNREDSGRAITLQADGKILVGGYSSTGSFEEIGFEKDHDFAVARYLRNGSLDESFSGDGKVTTQAGADMDWVNAIAVQTDGKIIVAGSNRVSIYDTPSEQFILVRYQSNGSLDSNFGNGGKVITELGIWSTAKAMIIQPDEKTLVAGETNMPDEGYNPDFALVRYRSDGSLDPDFGNGGKVTTGLSNSTDSAQALAIQADGKIVLAGYSYSDELDLNFALARFKENGELDLNFGSNGKIITDFNDNSDTANAVAVQVDNKIVVVGTSNSDFALARYRSDGSLDPGFGNGGKVTTDFSGNSDYATGIVIQADGKIVVAGTSNKDFALACYDSSGNLDASFGNGGKVITSLNGNNTASAIVLQADGRIVVAGESNGDFALARYQNSGFNAPAAYFFYLPLIIE